MSLEGSAIRKTIHLSRQSTPFFGVWHTPTWKLEALRSSVCLAVWTICIRNPNCRGCIEVSWGRGWGGWGIRKRRQTYFRATPSSKNHAILLSLLLSVFGVLPAFSSLASICSWSCSLDTISKLEVELMSEDGSSFDPLSSVSLHRKKSHAYLGDSDLN